MSGAVVELVLTTLDRRTPGLALADVVDLLPDPRHSEHWCDDDETCERVVQGLRRAET